MSTEVYVNDAATALAAPAASGATTITVVSSSGLPALAAGQFFRARIESAGSHEYVLVTAVAGTTWTVTRAQEGTAAAAWPAGATVTAVLTAQAMSTLAAAAGATGSLLFLGPDDPIPAGTPAPTLVVRSQSGPPPVEELEFVTATSTDGHSTPMSATATLASTVAGHLNVLVIETVAYASNHDAGLPLFNGGTAEALGWELIDSVYDDGSQGVRLSAYQRFFQAGDLAEIEVSVNEGASSAITCLAYQGAHPTDPVPSSSVLFKQQGTSSTSFPAGPITTTERGIIVTIAADKTSGTTWTVPDAIRTQSPATYSNAMVTSDTDAVVEPGTYSRTVIASVGTSVGVTGIFLIRSAT